jgi:hypothetical protein
MFAISSAIVASVLVVVLLVQNLNWARENSSCDYLLLSVDSGKCVGYSFVVNKPITKGSSFLDFQFVGFAVIMVGLLWESRHRICDAFKPMSRWIEAKKAIYVFSGLHSLAGTISIEPLAP